MDLTQLEIDIQNPIQDAGIQRSPCGALKWLNQNNPWGASFQTFVELEYNNGSQGIRAIKNGNVVKEIKIPIYGGLDGDPMKIIYQNNKTIIGQTIKHVLSQQA
jgi:hypothetical protein